jgi:agmatine deiminase
METLAKTPKESGYRMPAEWEPHERTWLSWPHNEKSWPGRIHTIFDSYTQFVKLLAESEKVGINVCNHQMREEAENMLYLGGVDMSKVDFYVHPTNDAWCRDHGPAFLVNSQLKKKIIVDWEYNAWGGKYPCDLDNNIPAFISLVLNLPSVRPGIVMEGGSVDFNGKGTVITTKACLLNKNRNPHLNQQQIEKYLMDYYGVSNVLWLGDGIVGDDTDGHVDDLTRFVNSSTVVTMVEYDGRKKNSRALTRNFIDLHDMELEDGKPLNVVEIPMPKKIQKIDGQVVPASYANFYVCNKYVIVPTFKDKHDDIACEILQKFFPDRKVMPLDSTDMIWGLGSWHCLSQQEPAV